MKNVWKNYIAEENLTLIEKEMMNWYDKEWASFDDEYNPKRQLENWREIVKETMNNRKVTKNEAERICKR